MTNLSCVSEEEVTPNRLKIFINFLEPPHISTVSARSVCIKVGCWVFVQNARTETKNNWASEASPTLGCSIEISRDIYIYICRYVCRGPKKRRRNYVGQTRREKERKTTRISAWPFSKDCTGVMKMRWREN